jgi:hypothetical protein
MVAILVMSASGAAVAQSSTRTKFSVRTIIVPAVVRHGIGAGAGTPSLSVHDASAGIID